MKIVRSAVPADVNPEATAVLAAHDISMAAFVHELLIRVAARDAETLTWRDGARR